MLSAVAIAKMVGLVGCSWGAWRTYASMPEPAARAKLRQVFRLGQLGIKRSKGKTEDFIYPVIDSVSIRMDCMQIKFTLPPGLDPDKVHKHLWLFRQKFGEEITLQGSNLAFTLRIYPSAIKPFDYDWKAVEKAMDGYNLPIVAGQSRDGWEVYDMVEYPHLLIAGETGAGKSTQLRSILCSLIHKMSTDRLHLYLADLKMTEFHIFKKVAHVRYNETNIGKVRAMLKKTVAEMEKRKKLLNEHEESHITSLPEEVIPPFILVMIDEFQQLDDDDACQDAMLLISQQGRALGVFLGLSCQRPDSKALDGAIKSNLTVRMAYRHADEVNSRITLGRSGAELIEEEEKGLMIMSKGGYKRIQSPYLSLAKAKEMLQPYKQKQPEVIEPQGEEEELLD